MTGTRKTGTRGCPLGAQVAPWHGPHQGRGGWPPGPLGPPQAPPFGLYIPHHPKNQKREEFRQFLRRPVAATYVEEKTSPAGRFCWGEHLPEGVIIAIVITIV